MSTITNLQLFFGHKYMIEILNDKYNNIYFFITQIFKNYIFILWLLQ